MKYPFLTLLLVLIASKTCLSQSTYYAPNNNVNITLTVREPYKPIDWSKISSDFSDQLNAIVAQREAQKRYLDEILYQTINSTHSYTQLTNDNVVNSCLLNLKTKIIERLNILNNLLKSGQITPESYESRLRKTYFDYVGANQVFLNLTVYKSNTISTLGTNSDKKSFEDKFNATIGSISNFEINDNSISFILYGLSYPNNNLNNLNQFVTSSCQGQFENYKLMWLKEKIREKKELEVRRANEMKWNEKKNSNHQIWHKFKVKVLDSRMVYLNQLNIDEQNEYYRNEKKIIFNSLMSEYKWSLSTRKLIKKKVDDFVNTDSQKNNFYSFIKQPFPLNILMAINKILPKPYQILDVPDEILDNMEFVQ